MSHQVDNWISISEAARHFNVSRRTVTRRIADDSLVTRTVGRERLVRLPDITRSLGIRPYDAVIDETLTIVFSATHRMENSLFGEVDRVELDIVALRQGPLGRDLRALAELATGEYQEPREVTLARIERVLIVLYRAAMFEDYVVPRAFWDSDLGMMLAAAKFQAFELDELVPVSDAAQFLGVAPATVYRWIDERRLDHVREALTGRVFVVKTSLRQVRDGEGGGNLDSGLDRPRGPPFLTLIAQRSALLRRPLASTHWKHVSGSTVPDSHRPFYTGQASSRSFDPSVRHSGTFFSQ